MLQIRATPGSSCKRVFDSVFPPAALQVLTSGDPHTTVTFWSSTTAGQSARSEVIEGTHVPTSPNRPSTASSHSTSNNTTAASALNEPWLDQATWGRAWHVATEFLAVPDKGFEVLAGFEGEQQVDEVEILEQWNRYDSLSKETADALAYVIREGFPSSPDQDLLEWYGNEVRRHFLRNFRSGLLQLLNHPEEEDPGTLQKVVGCLQLARRIYFAPLLQFLLPLVDSTAQEGAFVKFQRGFHAIVSYALPWSRISSLLTRELTREAWVILGIDTLGEEDGNRSATDDMDVDRKYSISYRDWRDEPSAEARMLMMTEGEDIRVTVARERLLSFIRDLQLVGLGGNKAQKVFASVMNAMLTAFIRAAYTGQWEGPTSVPQHLRQWVENLFSRLVVQVLAIINAPETEIKTQDRLDVSLGDVSKWQEIAVARLGALRTSELFEVIVEWPVSIGAIEDLRYFTTYPAARSYLTHSFTAVLNQRLLHPGASTVEILQVYISIIRAFNLLDPKGVLLDRVARPIRRYLRDRNDTIKVIVGGLLADPVDATGQPDSSSTETLVELAAELANAHRQASLRNDSGELDWDDMNWMPDPIDAAPDYRKSRSSDVIGSLISLFESKEAFVKEMQNVLAERLLRKRADFDQEMSVLELLKVRFGDSALQACEVMLRDIFDSRRVDAVVRNDQGLVAGPVTPGSPADIIEESGMPELHAKILSRFFWPEIQGQDFKVPDEVSQLQQRYAAGFESLKQSRKLSWINGLGQVTVELDLEDRVFIDEVTTWQASVIYAFQSNAPDPVTLSVPELSEELQMTPSLVRSACLFWVSKRILTEASRDRFRVLEVLPSETQDTDTGDIDDPSTSTKGKDDDAARAAAAASAAEAMAAKESAEAAAMEKMNLYWQFIMGMLTNQGAMPLQKIAMMLKMVVPGGFPFSNEELREFLAGMVAKGKLEIGSGGNYRIVS